MSLFDSFESTILKKSFILSGKSCGISIVCILLELKIFFNSFFLHSFIFILGVLKQSLEISGQDSSPAIKLKLPNFLTTLG